QKQKKHRAMETGSTTTAHTLSGPPKWIPDSEAVACGFCSQPFSWLRRRHHCRCCGGVFCYACCSNFFHFPENYNYTKPQRACRNCEKKFVNEKERALLDEKRERKSKGKTKKSTLE